MDEELKKRLEKIEKRLDALESFLEEFPTFEKSTNYELGDALDGLYDKALWIVLQHDKCSASLLQRRLQIGFNRACRILEQLEVNGIVSPAEGSQPRDVLVKEKDIELLKEKLEDKFESLKEGKKKN